MIFGEGRIMFLWGWLPISEQMTTYTYNMGRPNYTQWIYKMNIILKTGYEVGIVSGGWKVDMSDMSGDIYIYIFQDDICQEINGCLKRNDPYALECLTMHTWWCRLRRFR